MFFIFICFGAYLLGAIPFGLLFAKYFRLGDPRHFASGNIGASNMARLGGYKIGILTFAFDFLKAFLPTIIAVYYYPTANNLKSAGIIGFCALVGHCYPIYLKFNGGKGVASAAGLLMALQPLPTFFGLLFWGICFFFSRITSLSALLACTFVLLLCAFLNGYDSFIFLLTTAAVLLIVIRHKANIKALLTKTERSFKKQN